MAKRKWALAPATIVFSKMSIAAAKAGIPGWFLSARLKSCPVTKPTKIEFFRSLYSIELTLAGRWHSLSVCVFLWRSQAKVVDMKRLQYSSTESLDLCQCAPVECPHVSA